jgi:Protein of unknown function (DUF3592)
MKYAVFAIAMGFDLFFLAGLFVRFREVLAAKHWREGSGRIITSRVEARRVRRASDDADTRTPTYDLRNFAAVTYLFDTSNGAQRGSRISISGEIIESQVAETIERYPKNAKVTVYYDPADPKRCVLERDVIEPAFKVIFIIGIGFAIALCLFVVS